MNHRQRMEAGLPYQAWKDGLPQARMEAKKLTYAFNHLPPEEWAHGLELLRQLLGSAGTDLWIEAPFHCDYGFRTHVGNHFYANYNLTILDVGKVSIGDWCMIGPNVSLLAAGHPIHPQARNSGYEYGRDITIGNNVWIGGGAILLPGVTVGDNVVIAAGSVVRQDLPNHVVAAGNPCRPIRSITRADRDFYFRHLPFDVTDYLVPDDPSFPTE
ncbi:MAG: sugar O-acetyltransferase [Lawsonibacter sp.]|jgi:maltose O-acetyltransferase